MSRAAEEDYSPNFSGTFTRIRLYEHIKETEITSASGGWKRGSGRTVLYNIQYTHTGAASHGLGYTGGGGGGVGGRGTQSCPPPTPARPGLTHTHTNIHNTYIVYTS